MTTGTKTAALTVEPRIEVGLKSEAVTTVDLDWPADCGGEVCFLGRTRQEIHPEHGELKRLEYEVYEPMAQKLMEDMARHASSRFGCRVVRLVHAQGPVEPGQASVVIQVAGPHRSEAFAACRYLIDRLKHELPIWKREIWAQGQTFVEGCCAQGGDADPTLHAAPDTMDST